MNKCRTCVHWTAVTARDESTTYGVCVVGPQKVLRIDEDWCDLQRQRIDAPTDELEECDGKGCEHWPGPCLGHSAG